MVYLVVNMHRSGSSMLMRCLEAGGLDPVYDKFNDILEYHTPLDYLPNPNGFYQFDGPFDDAFYNLHIGKLIKCPIKNISKLPKGNYKVIILRRNPEEIRASMARWTPFVSWGAQEVMTYFYEEYLSALKSILEVRGDMSIVEIEYKNIIKNPINVFEWLQSQGWPINPNLCAEKVDNTLYRNRLEKDI